MTKVRRLPPFPFGGTNAVRAATRVRGPGQWRAWAADVNWLMACGFPLVVAGPSFLVMDPGDSRTFAYYLWPREQCPNRVWILSLINAGPGIAFGTFEAPDGTEIGTWSAPVIGARTQTFKFTTDQFTPTSTPGSTTCKVKLDADSLGSVYVEGISCHELPRYDLLSFSASQVPDESSLNAKRLIFQDPDDELSLNAVAKAAQHAIAESRRSCLFSQCFPDGIVGGTSDPGGEETDPLEDGGASNVFDADIPIQPRLLYRNQTSKAVAFAVLASIPSGSGTVRLRSDILDTTDIAITGSTAAWYTDTVLCKTEDPSRRLIDGGLRGGDLGLVRVTAWGAAAPTIYSVCAAEYPK